MFRVPSMDQSSSSDSSILVAVIAVFGVLISALVSAFVSILVSRWSVKNDRDRSATEYLRRKIEVLERHKAALVHDGCEPLSSFAKTPNGIAEAAAKALIGSFGSTGRVFAEAKHYLEPHVSQALSQRLDLIHRSMARERAKSWGVDVAQGRDNRLSLIRGANNVEAMRGFIDSVQQSIDSELSISVQKIEQLIHVRGVSRDR